MRKWLAGFLLVAASTSVAIADTPKVMGEMERASTTTPQDLISAAQSAMDSINSAVAYVDKLMEQANNEKPPDAEKIQCLQTSLTPMKALQTAATESQKNMQLQLSSNNTEMAGFYARQISSALNSVNDFRADAQSCVDDSGGQDGVTSTSSNIPEESGPESALPTEDAQDPPIVIPDPSPN